MSQVSNSSIPFSNQIRAHWMVAWAAVLALLATAAVVLVLVIDDGTSSNTGPIAHRSQPVGSHADGASTVALPRAVPDNPAYTAAVGASVGAGRTQAGHPSESQIAAAVSGR